MYNNGFTNLILLIGTNPLPNYVVLKYFSESQKLLNNIWFVYSEENASQSGTKRYAENIKRALDNDKLNYHYVKISDVENLKSILFDLYAGILKDKEELKDCSVHLNYTGGTKTMGLAARLFVEKHFTNKSYSYLSARSFTIFNEDGEAISPFDLRNKIRISLNDLLSLHSFNRINDEPVKPNFEKLLNEYFIKKIDEGRISDYFNEYDRTMFLNTKGNLIDKYSELKIKWEGKIPGKEFAEINLKLEDDYKMFSETGMIKDLSNHNVKRTLLFLDGGWLETYISDTISLTLNDSTIKLYSDIKAKKQKWLRDFQLDAALICGYQIYGISITTESNKGLCKLKGFEVLTRARQIGGEEAKAILISMLNNENKEDLKEELLLDTGGSKENILVLGVEDLKKVLLIKQIKKFIE